MKPLALDLCVMGRLVDILYLLVAAGWYRRGSTGLGVRKPGCWCQLCHSHHIAVGQSHLYFECGCGSNLISRDHLTIIDP